MGFLRQLVVICAINIVAGIGLTACKKSSAAASPETREKPSAHPEILQQLTASRLALARIEAENLQFDRALLFALSAWQTDPASSEARATFAEFLCTTRWAFPIAQFRFPFPIQQIAPLGPNHVLIALGAEAGTVVRWNVKTHEIESVLFPVPGAHFHWLAADPSGRYVVVNRAGFSLLCDAVSLKPIADLGPHPASLNPQSTIAFSSDGVILAHPTSAADGQTTWHIRGTTGGETLRTTGPDLPPALAAHVDRRALTLLHEDGSHTRIPLNPTQLLTHTPLDPPEKLNAAAWARDGNSAIVLRQTSSSPVVSQLDFTATSDHSLATDALLERFPWSPQQTIWNALLHDPAHALFRIDGPQAAFYTGHRAPLTGIAKITALAHHNRRAFLGGEDGSLFLFHHLPSSTEKLVTQIAQPNDNLISLSEVLTGLRFNHDNNTFSPISLSTRKELLNRIDIPAITKMFPHFPVAEIETLRQLPPPPSPAPETFIPLFDRLARADPQGASWPALLHRAGTLTLTDWHRTLSARVAHPAENHPARDVDAVFSTGDEKQIQDLLVALPPCGPRTATALRHALASDHPEWIQAILLRTPELPELLKRLAVSRIALLENRTADALEIWTDSFPDIAENRKRHDWDGWEIADFSPALHAMRDRLHAEIAAITLPADASLDQKQEIASRLADPETIRTIGKSRFVTACTAAAASLCHDPATAENALTLTTLAGRFGGNPAALLRSEATAYTTLLRFPEAHQRWLKLISEIPLKQQTANDYAEAAYTAYENREFSPAMEILTTGSHRFPHNADFALRAGWISLLAGESGQAYRFLVIGRQIGYPPDQVENATALLCVAAARAGAPDDSSAFHKELLRINPRWNDSETLDALAWPDEFKSILRDVPAPPAAIESPGVLPEKP